ncbi:MAG: SLC45 family MFS transporter [Sphingorhabdus sp.]|uniref:MFS transporter n=1 Tax=Sphingorhabdus sp. TaxID=1902408 RepID=UPI0025DE69C7|nr:MFS transporter [Sphingorhabdus sp.]MCO4091800.1 SLC45 family MFS transporter [Sphingorhabdus sp.]
MSEQAIQKPILSIANLAQMNLGFFGLQFSFGLQQSNMGPIYNYLGAEESTLPLLFLAGPVTGLIVQPIVGAMSDRTLSKYGRRTPYFLIGALLCSICLLLMPLSAALWMAVSLLWILDAANNITMEPYRAYVSDRLVTQQQPAGFLMQASFTGLAQTLAYLAPVIFVALGMNKDAVDANGIPHIAHAAFYTGAFLSITTIAWSVFRIRELPLSEAQIKHIRANPLTPKATILEIWNAIRDMPLTMRQLVLMMLFQWYGMFCYWQYIVNALARGVFDTTDAASQGYRDAALLNGQIGGFYNFVAFLAGFALIPFSRRFGPKIMHVVSIGFAGIAMLTLPYIEKSSLLFIPMVGIGLGWASIMGNPYVIVARSIPPERTGVYMGIFNMMIVIPMLIQTVTLPLFYDSILGGNPQNVIMLAGSFLLIAAIFMTRVREQA